MTVTAQNLFKSPRQERVIYVCAGTVVTCTGSTVSLPEAINNRIDVNYILRPYPFPIMVLTFWAKAWCYNIEPLTGAIIFKQVLLCILRRTITTLFWYGRSYRKKGRYKKEHPPLPFSHTIIYIINSHIMSTTKAKNELTPWSSHKK
jgi:hypothetical protein